MRSVRNVNKDDAHSMQDDTISRQAAIDAINRAVTKEVARWSVKELPSAEVDPINRTRNRNVGWHRFYGRNSGKDKG